jgi:hypothetical protein
LCIGRGIYFLSIPSFYKTIINAITTKLTKDIGIKILPAHCHKLINPEAGGASILATLYKNKEDSLNGKTRKIVPQAQTS